MSIRYMSSVWEDHTIQSRTQLLILLAIADCANDQGFAWPSLETISRKARTSTRAVQERLEELKTDGKIEIEIGKGRNGTNVYRLIIGGVQMPHPADTAGKIPGKNPAVAAPNPSGTVRNSQEQSLPERAKKEKVARSPEDRLAFQAFIDKWCAAFLRHSGKPYQLDGRDFKVIYGLLKHSTPEELVSLAERAWRDEFRAGQAGTILSFSWNHPKLLMAFADRSVADPHAVNGF